MTTQSIAGADSAGAAAPPRRRRLVGLLVTVVLLASVIMLSLMIGARDVPLHVVWETLIGTSADSDAETVLSLWKAVVAMENDLWE